MAKESGLGDGLFVNGYDLSGDIQQVNQISSPRAVIDVTGINKRAYERIYGLRDGVIDMTTHFNTSAGQQFPTLKQVPDTDSQIMYRHGSTIGNVACALTSKRTNFDMTRGTDGAVTFAVNAQANGYGLEWGVQMTSGAQTSGPLGASSSTSNTSVDGGASSSFGAQIYIQVFGYTGTDATIVIQESSDNGGTDPFTAITGGSQVVSGANTVYRLATATNQTVKRYLRARVSTTAGLTSITWAVMVVRNAVAPVF